MTPLFQGSTKLFPVDMIDRIFVLTQKDSNVKKESYTENTDPISVFLYSSLGTTDRPNGLQFDI